VRRTPTYYLPWITRPGLECVLILSNVEARFKQGYNEGPYTAAVTQFDAAGRVVYRAPLLLRDCTEVVELRLDAVASGYGFVTVEGDRLRSDLYVTLSDGESYAATHGRHEWVEWYPTRTRLALAIGGACAAAMGRTIPAFAKDQFVYVGADSRSHLLILNLAEVGNRIGVRAGRAGAQSQTRLLALPPRGAHLLDVAGFLGSSRETSIWRLRLEANAWFNFYVVGAGTRDLAGPLSLMHVK
jgi:hypothetical protein